MQSIVKGGDIVNPVSGRGTMKKGNEEEMEKVRKSERQKEMDFVTNLDQFDKAKRNGQCVEISILQTKILIEQGVWID